MTERLITPPVATAVLLADARTAARLDGNNDAELEAVVRAITEDAEHITGRAFITQTWRVVLDAFPDAIRLPKPPVASVVSVKYMNASGVEVTLSPADYYVDNITEPGYIVPASGKAWPATFAHLNAVTVEVTCGYGISDASVPSSVKGYILAKVAEHFAPLGTPKSEYLVRLLDRMRVYS